MKPDDPEVGSKADREKDFHDERFAHGSRSAGRFYAITGSSAAAHESLVDSIEPPTKVLELGCGLNTSAWDLARRGVEVTSIDISTVAVEAAEAQRRQRNLHNAEFIEMNAESLDFADDSFDVVLGQGILHHLDMATAVSECARVLKPTGRLIATEPMGNNPAINLYRSRTPDQRTDDEHPFRTRDFDLLEAGFEDVRLQFFHFLSLGALALSRTKSFDRALHSLERADEKIFDKLPWSRNLAWMVVIEAINPRK